VNEWDLPSPYVHQVVASAADIDGYGHVNNAVVLTYLEEGRDRFLESLGMDRSQYVVGRCSVSFNREQRE